MQYPVLRTAQSTFTLTSLVDLFNQTPFLVLWEPSRWEATTHYLSNKLIFITVVLNKCCGIILPGRMPGHWKTDVKLLPLNCSKTKVYDSYCANCDDSGIRKVAVCIVRLLWQQLMPYVTTMPPATHLCWHCHNDCSRLISGL